ncbi:MAG: hypothetical protein LBM19_03735 [Holosporales bacterium]|jgi:hypothetical protein|nr:hypothetical protein [Holosporales bacterium]
MQSFELIVNISLAIFGTILTIQDIVKKEVGYAPLLGFACCCIALFYFRREICLVPFVVFATIGVIYFITKKTYALGAADYIIAFFISFLLPNAKWPIFLTLCGVFGIITRLFINSQKIPFIPSILASYAVTKAFL